MRRAVILLAVLAVVLVGLDLGLRLVGEYHAGAQIQRSMGLPERPDVSLKGFPFLGHLATGDFSSVSVEASDTEFEGIEVESVRLTLRDVAFPPGQLLFGGESTVRAEEGEGTVSLTAEAINRALEAEVPAEVRFSGDRMLVRLQSPRTEEVETRLTVRDGRLLATPVGAGLPITLSFELPTLLPGLRYTGVRVTEATATLSFLVPDVSLEIPGSGPGG